MTEYLVDIGWIAFGSGFIALTLAFVKSHNIFWWTALICFSIVILLSLFRIIQRLNHWI